MTLTDSVERCLRKGNFPESESPRRSEGCAACCAVSLVCRSGDRPPCHCPSAGGTACLGELRGRLGVGWGRALISLPWPTAGKQEGLGWLSSLLTPEQGMAIVTCVMWGAGVGGARVCEREQDLEGHS